MKYSIGQVEYDVNTKHRSREIADLILTVIDNPEHKDREYLMSQAVNKILYGVRGEFFLKENTTVADFLYHKTDVGQVCRVLDDGYKYFMVEIDDEDLFCLPKTIGERIIKKIEYDYSQRINELPLITLFT